MKKNFPLALLGVCLLLLLINYSCQNDSIDKETANLNYSGEEIFRGVYFYQGDLPNHIDALKLDQEQSEAAMATDDNVKEFKEDFYKEIIKSINTLDPNYFSKFKEQIESKNYFAMQLALTNGVKMIKAGGYNSKYSGLFKLSDKLESKKADFNSKEFKDIDVNTPEGVAKYKSLIKDKYDIDIDNEDYKVACSPGGFVCVVAIAVAVVSYVAGAYTAVAVAQVYSKVEYWGGATNETAIGNVLIEELADKLGSSQGFSKNTLSY